jgi:hypothetical protein
LCWWRAESEEWRVELKMKLWAASVQKGEAEAEKIYRSNSAQVTLN